MAQIIVLSFSSEGGRTEGIGDESVDGRRHVTCFGDAAREARLTHTEARQRTSQ